MHGKRKRRVVLVTLIAAILAATMIWTLWGNTALELNTYTVTSKRLPEEFSGFRIAHVSDLHNAKMGRNNEKLLAMLKEAAPDMIAITGDLIDSRSTDVEVALQFAQEAVKIATCYYVTGNHEARVAEYVDLKKGLLELGVIVLEDQRVELEHSGATIWLLGIDDPSFETDYLLGDAEAVADRKLKQLMPDEDGFSVLLSHRPELFEVYWRYDVDLILTGHAHGGQFRFPFVGGLVAPNQGIFPDYDAGTYTEGHTHMIVSRGIGNSIIPIRFNNRPEVLLIELQSVSE